MTTSKLCAGHQSAAGPNEGMQLRLLSTSWILLLLLMLPAVVQAQFNYTTNNGTITITRYTGSGGAVSIPSTIDGLPVTTIGSAAFMECTNLTTVTIPNSVTSIGYMAFRVCKSLSNVTIGNSVTNIGDYAFNWCTSLANVTIGTNVTSIGYDAFHFCFSLTSVAIPNSVTSIEEYAFAVCTNVTSLTIGTNVTTLKYHVFEQCFSLTSVTIPDSVTSIRVAAFNGCTSLTNVTIGSGVTSIADNAFLDCASLTAITVGALNSVYSSEGGVLFDKSQTTLVKYPQAKAGSYTIPGSVTSIGAVAFAFCGSLTNVTIGESVTNIGGSAFVFCTNLTSVYFKGNAPAADSSVFANDNNATVYYLPGTTGWGPAFGGRPTALWFLPNPVILNNGPSFGVQADQFGFIISWATIVPVTVEACTNLSSPIWSAIQTVTLSNGWAYFSDPQWTSYPGRFYRLRWP